LISQLTAILQQTQNPARTSATQQDKTEDEHLSAASLPVHSNPNPVIQDATLHTPSQAMLNPGTATTYSAVGKKTASACTTSYSFQNSGQDSKR